MRTAAAESREDRERRLPKSIKLIKQYTEMRQMMRQLSSSGMFGGSGLKRQDDEKDDRHAGHGRIWR